MSSILYNPSSPGAEFYRRRLERARALQRSPDVRAWLRSADALEAASNVLPVLQLGQTLLQPAGGEAALAALLRMLAHIFCYPPEDLQHPYAARDLLMPQLPPVMRVLWVGEGGNICLQSSGLLDRIASMPPQHASDTDVGLELVARLLLLAHFAKYEGIDRIDLGMNVLDYIKPVLFGADNSAKLARQLAELQERTSGGSDAAASDPLPTVHDLQMDDSSGFEHPLVYLSRCLNVAAAQGSDYWVARSCYLAGYHAVFTSDPGYAPAQVAQLFELADAAYERCKRVLPHTWVYRVKREREMRQTVQRTLADHLARSPGSWRRPIQDAHSAEQRDEARNILARHSAGPPVCDECGRRTGAVQNCSGCKQAKYCSKACQLKAWPGHKAACKAARAAAAAAGVGPAGT